MHLDVQVPTHLTEEQEELLRQLAQLRGEEQPLGVPHIQPTGFFSKIKDAFAGR